MTNNVKSEVIQFLFCKHKTLTPSETLSELCEKSEYSTTAVCENCVIKNQI
jgi:hypothetical protein